jgi:hypothetical protein
MRKVQLHGKVAAGRVALVDDEDYDLVIGYRWNVFEQERPSGSRSLYAVSGSVWFSGKQSHVYMHKLITGWPLTDHRDHNGLNNQRSNLRQVSGTQNQWNRRPAGSRLYKGTCWLPKEGRWRARITVNGQDRYLGRFASEAEAALAYDRAAAEAFGEFAYLNFPGAA